MRDRYTQAIFRLQTFSVLTAYLVEYVFYEQASRHFRDRASLAGFLGAFTGGTTLAMVLVSGLLTGRLIASRGVRGTLFVMPLAMMATSLAATAFGGLFGIGTTVFVLIATAMFANQVLDKAVHTPAFVLLFQPMPRERRMPVRIMVEGWLGSVALILSGVLLLFVASLHPSASSRSRLCSSWCRQLSCCSAARPRPSMRKPCCAPRVVASRPRATSRWFVRPGRRAA